MQHNQKMQSTKLQNPETEEGGSSTTEKGRYSDTIDRTEEVNKLWECGMYIFPSLPAPLTMHN